jgi:hypothetical protein
MPDGTISRLPRGKANSKEGAVPRVLLPENHPPAKRRNPSQETKIGNLWIMRNCYLQQIIIPLWITSTLFNCFLHAGFQRLFQNSLFRIVGVRTYCTYLNELYYDQTGQFKYAYCLKMFCNYCIKQYEMKIHFFGTL